MEDFTTFVAVLLGKKLQKGDSSNLLFEPYEGSTETFTAYYNKEIWPLLQAFEEKRADIFRQERPKFILSIPLFLLTIGIAVVFIVTPANNNIAALLFITCCICFVIFLRFLNLASNIGDNFLAEVKTEINKKIYKFFGDLQYSDDNNFTSTLYNTYAIQPLITRSILYSSVAGTYKGIPIQLTDGLLDWQYNSLFMLFTFKKSNYGTTIIRTKHFELSKMDIEIFTGLDKIELENPDFNAKFLVYTTDQVEARAILNNSFIENLYKLSTTFNDRLIELFFYGNNCFIVLHILSDYTLDDLSLYAPLTLEQEINAIIKNMNNISSVINILEFGDKTKS